MTEPIKTSQGRIWIQPNGPTNPVYLLGCKSLGDITIPDGDITLIPCFNANGDGWDFIGSTFSAPDAPSTSIDSLLFPDRDWLERVKCTFALYILSRDCGRADVFPNYVRGQIIAGARRLQRTYSNLVHQSEDNPSGLGVDIKGLAVYDVDPLTVVRIAVAEILALNSVWANIDSRCYGDCGDTLNLGELGAAVADGGAGSANVDFTFDEGLNWNAGAADPFAVGMHIKAVTSFYIGRDTRRLLVSKEGTGGVVQGQVAFSDDNGATWTLVSIGGAAVGHGATKHRGLFALDMHNIWLVSALGYIYKSIDGGETWTAYEKGTLTLGNYSQVHFADQTYGIAGAPADIIVLSDNGGISWYAATVTGGGGDILTVWRFDKNRMMVGDDDGKLWYSSDGGNSWAQITGWIGSGTGDVVDLYFVNDFQGFLVHNSAVPVGNILRTIDGGAHWEVLNYITNLGLNGIWAANHNLAYAVGEVVAATGVLLKISAPSL